MMGSRDQIDDITEPLKVEGVTTDKSSVDDYLSEAKKNKDVKGREYENQKSEASIHLVVDNEPLKVPGNSLVKDSYKFIQICDTDPNPDGKPILNGHIPSKTQNDAEKDKNDIPMRAMVLTDKPDHEGGKMWKASKSQEFWCMFFMLMANLLNYMDRVTIAGKCWPTNQIIGETSI